jgi:hypothetical protein
MDGEGVGSGGLGGVGGWDSDESYGVSSHFLRLSDGLLLDIVDEEWTKDTLSDDGWVFPFFFLSSSLCAFFLPVAFCSPLSFMIWQR